MIEKYLKKLEDPKRPLLGPNLKALKFWGLLLPTSTPKRYFYLLMHILVTIFTATEYADIYFIKTDMNLVLNNLKITMLATMSVIKVTTFIFWQKHWINIIEYVTKADINIRKNANLKKNIVIVNKTKYCRRITYFYWSLMYTTVIIVIFTPIFKFFLSENYRENVNNGTVSYTEVVSSWVPFDKTTITGYLTASAIQTYAAIYGGGWITSFDSNAMVIMVFFRLELEMLRIDASDIFGSEGVGLVGPEESIKRLKNCHNRHVELVKYARLFDSCLSPIMLLYMFVCSVMLCVTTYQITIETNAAQKFLTAEYLVFGVAQLFIYCWHSNDVLYTSQDLTLGPFEGTWWLSDKRLRKNVLMLSAQFRKVVVFSAGPFTQLTVPTFVSILKGAYSYYTLLSKSQMK